MAIADVFSTYPTLIDELSNQQTMTQIEAMGYTLA